MNSLSQLSRKILGVVVEGYSHFKSCEEVDTKVEQFLSTLPTFSPQYHKITLQYVAQAVKTLKTSELVIFGYWYLGDFYTTQEESKHPHVKILHSLLTTPEELGKLERGQYYEDNLQFYSK